MSAALEAAEAGVDVLLVGDSLGMVVLGFEDTTQVIARHGITKRLANLVFGPTEKVGCQGNGRDARDE